MPLRGWFRAHSRPGWYSWVVVVGMTMASIGISTTVNIKLSERTIRQNEASQRRQSEQARLTSCALITAQDDVFKETPPPSVAGRNAAQAWHDLSIEFHC